MLNRQKLVADFEAIVGWPYASPGNNDQTGIDCSGAFVRAYHRQGASLYHGSNRMARCAVSWLKPTGEIVPQAGMVVFKARGEVTQAAYRPGGAYYQPDRMEDYYHVGLITSAEPLRVVHATPPKARADGSLKGWTRIGWLKDVEEEESMAEELVVSATSVNLREKPDKHSTLLAVLPKGTRVTGEQAGDAWYRVTAGERSGYCMSAYLAKAEEATVTLPRSLCQQMMSALQEALGKETT